MPFFNQKLSFFKAKFFAKRVLPTDQTFLSQNKESNSFPFSDIKIEFLKQGNLRKRRSSNRISKISILDMIAYDTIHNSIP